VVSRVRIPPSPLLPRNGCAAQAGLNVADLFGGYWDRALDWDAGRIGLSWRSLGEVAMKAALEQHRLAEEAGDLGVDGVPVGRLLVGYYKY
jgi:hypothetical protein